MKLGSTWTRRTFLANASLASAAMIHSVSTYARASNQKETATKPLLACVASSHRLEAFIVQGPEKHLLAELSSPEPFGAIAIHPSQNVVYAAYGTNEYLGLPGASIAAFAMEHSSRSFVLLSRRALTLSATHPRHVSISPDGKTILVSATGGGAYNTFETAVDGRLLSPPHVLKLTGCGPHPLQHSAQPVFSAFHRSGEYAYACDLGSDRIDHITFVNGAPVIVSRASVLPGSGPCHLSMHPSQETIAVVSTLRPLVSILEIDSRSGRLGSASHWRIPDAVSLAHGTFQAYGSEFCVHGLTQSGASAVFMLEPDQPRQRVRRALPAHGYSEDLPASGSSPWLGTKSAMMASRELTLPMRS